jgi:hypothetical protein
MWGMLSERVGFVAWRTGTALAGWMAYEAGRGGGTSLDTLFLFLLVSFFFFSRCVHGMVREVRVVGLAMAGTGHTCWLLVALWQALEGIGVESQPKLLKLPRRHQPNASASIFVHRPSYDGCTRHHHASADRMVSVPHELCPSLYGEQPVLFSFHPAPLGMGAQATFIGLLSLTGHFSSLFLQLREVGLDRPADIQECQFSFPFIPRHSVSLLPCATLYTT